MTARHILGVVLAMSIRTRSTVYDAVVANLLHVPSASTGQHLGGVSGSAAKVEPAVRELLADPELDSWSEALDRVGNCARPIRMRGQSSTVDEGDW